MLATMATPKTTKPAPRVITDEMQELLLVHRAGICRSVELQQAEGIPIEGIAVVLLGPDYVRANGLSDKAEPDGSMVRVGTRKQAALFAAATKQAELALRLAGPGLDDAVAVLVVVGGVAEVVKMKLSQQAWEA